MPYKDPEKRKSFAKDNYAKIKARLPLTSCECGCGAVIRGRFVSGHNLLVNRNPPWTPEHKTAYFKEYNKNYREEHKERLAANKKTWRENDLERITELKMNYYYQTHYDMTPEEATKMRSTRSGCDICGGPPGGKWKVFAIDHDHETGQVRGILCNVCNTALGKFKDDPALLIRAAEYVSYYKEIADGSFVLRSEDAGSQVGAGSDGAYDSEVPA